MKKVQILIYLFALMVAVVGCKENALELTNEQVCLNYEGVASCEKGQEAAYQIALADGKPTLKVLPTGGMPIGADILGYGDPQPLEIGALSISVQDGKISLSQGSRQFADATGQGFLLIRDPKGAYSILAAEEKSGVNEGVTLIDPTKVNRRIEFLMQDLTQDLMMLQTVNIIINDEGTQYVPNDTGTSVIITDNFRFVGNCNATAPEVCCTNFDPEAAPISWEPLVGEYAAGGFRLLHCFPVGSICTYVSGLKLIVKDCETNQTYCFDRSVCSVAIDVSDANGVCISVPNDCPLENPFQ